MKVLLVDDHPLFLEGLKNMLTSHGIDVVGTARDGLEGLQLARALHPEIVLMDIMMPHLNGLAALRLIRAEMPEVKVVMLTMMEDDDNLFEAIKSGACGYFLKSQDTDDFLTMLDNLAHGEMGLAPELANRLMLEFGRLASRDGLRPDRHDEDLTARQTEVLALVAQGFTYKEVGARLHLTERTVKYHMGEIVQRLHVKNRGQAVAHMQESGLNVPDKAHMHEPG
jgi:DNA-binding NarL/FixJ family response regulator